MLQEIIKAARTYDRPRTAELVDALVRRVRDTRETLEKRPLVDALTELRNNRWFDLLQAAADAVIESGDARVPVRRLYAQALIDGGRIAASIPVLERLIADAEGWERDDARGILGRAWKQAYVERPGRSAEKLLMERSLEHYYGPYVDEPDENLYQGVNAVAMLARAHRDGVRVSGAYPDYRELAGTIRDAARERNRDAWDYATAAEACVALGEWEEALRYTQEYVSDANISPFAAAGTRRQFLEIWGLSRTGDGEGGPIVHLLEAALLAGKGGEALEANGAGDAAQAIRSESVVLEAVLGDEKYKTLEWYRTGLTRASAVGRIIREGVGPRGTGFLIKVGREQFFVTNHHVIPIEVPDINRAYVTFESLDEGMTRYRIAERLWTSPVPELDVTIVRLAENVRGVEPYPLCPALPPLDGNPRVYVIGHPRGGTLSFSIADNLLLDHRDPKLHYRAPTEPGSSGSPVFDEAWDLLALHHSGGTGMPRLHGDGTYAANEGLYFNAILGEFERRHAH